MTPVLRRAAVTVPGMLALGFLSGTSVSAGGGDPWYASLAKPAGTPPDWAFPVAWTLIYICMGLALALGSSQRRGVLAFAAAVALALVWMPVFFGAHLIWPALWIALGMIASGSVAAVRFARAHRAAAWAMLPFLVWTGYAAGLTWGIARLNA